MVNDFGEWGGRGVRLMLVLVLLAPVLAACSDDAEDVSVQEQTPSGADAAAADPRVEEGVAAMIQTGERYASILGQLQTVEDVEEHRQEISKIFAAMKELETTYGDRQQEITARLDTNARSVAVNDRLRTELMRIAGDSALATSLAEIRASVTGIPLE